MGNDELEELVALLRQRDERLAGGFRLAEHEAVQSLRSFLGRQNTASQTLVDVKQSLEEHGETDSAGIHPLDYVCCPDGVRSIRERIEEALRTCRDAGATGADFQAQIVDTLAGVFGRENLTNPNERLKRFLEEALELVRTGGLSPQEIGAVVAYELGRSTGPDLDQEFGGAAVTLYALAAAFQRNLTRCALVEIDRVRMNRERCRQKHAAKPESVVSTSAS